VPLNAWFRFRRAVEDTPSILLLVEQESNAKTCASLVLRLRAEQPQWLATHEATEGKPQGPVRQRRMGTLSYSESWSCLLGGFAVRAERLRARVQPAQEITFAGAPPRTASGADGLGIFQTRTEWSYFNQPKTK
jgi:hypothetical protein